MIDKDKVIIMTKLAMYENEKGREDIPLMDYYKFDYISLSNLKNQLSVTIALVLIFGIHALDILLKNISHITDVDFVAIGTGYLKIWIIVIIVYTVVTTAYSWYEYSKSEKRIKEYKSLMNKLGQ